VIIRIEKRVDRVRDQDFGPGSRKPEHVERVADHTSRNSTKIVEHHEHGFVLEDQREEGKDRP